MQRKRGSSRKRKRGVRKQMKRGARSKRKSGVSKKMKRGARRKRIGQYARIKMKNGVISFFMKRGV